MEMTFLYCIAAFIAGLALGLFVRDGRQVGFTGPDYDTSAIDALVRLVEQGTVLESDISRGSICEMKFSSGGHSVAITWYPEGRLRTLSFDGKDAPTSMAGSKRVLAAAIARAETEFLDRANRIIASA